MGQFHLPMYSNAFWTIVPLPNGGSAVALCSAPFWQMPALFSIQRRGGAHHGAALTRAAHPAIRIGGIIRRDFDMVLEHCQDGAHEGHFSEPFRNSIGDEISGLEVPGSKLNSNGHFSSACPMPSMMSSACSYSGPSFEPRCACDKEKLPTAPRREIPHPRHRPPCAASSSGPHRRAKLHQPGLNDGGNVRGMPRKIDILSATSTMLAMS